MLKIRMICRSLLFLDRNPAVCLQIAATKRQTTTSSKAVSVGKDQQSECTDSVAQAYRWVEKSHH